MAAAARNTAALTDLLTDFPDQVLPLTVDVRSEASVQDAVQATVQRFGRIDVVANNAAYGLFGGVEEATDQQVRDIFDTNVFGASNVLRAVLPVLRGQRSGHILQGSSVYGLTSHAGVGLLAATKHALEGLTDALREEVAPLGIHVTLIEPGMTATPFLANLQVATPIADYDATVRQVQQAIGALPPTAFLNPALLAQTVLMALDQDTPPTRLVLGESALNAVQTTLEGRLQDLKQWQPLTLAAAGKTVQPV
ncbi:short-chain dehydrogenase/reductase [Deinococcus cellulosilyticus NBRC 106333 = KACC 11606]|uniref:Short-chain dehydrogenase/reductase n=1 Tax=Deinococcus cellulosilyticus (strain DSM 18568 / NBRC 106333 / KACC 11606 / 5516J-15) TaxID=1223518 RepID=A0A511MVF3_DEIC1|nr:short-chain dehydrogenase/reductase [Deinococcus cellulosilyticus NBRC 106333 = KACC 11606]